MKNGILASVALLLACTGFAVAEDPCCGHGPCNEFLYFSADYLQWWVKDGPQPFSVLTAGGVTPASQFDYGGFPGGRLTVGYGCDPEQSAAVEVSGFLLPRRSITQSFQSSDVNPVLGIPFTDVLAGTGNAFLIAEPGVSTGSLAMTSSSRLWGAEANLVKWYFKGCHWQLEGLIGFRYLNLEEDLNLTAESTAIPTPPVTPVTPITPETPTTPPIILFSNRNTVVDPLFTSDTFRTRNQFYGGQVGVRSEFFLGRFSLGLQAKLALGATSEVLDVGGTTTNITGATATTVAGGQFALASNSGHFTRSVFAIVPEGEVRLCCQVSPTISLFAGYDLLYWSRVARPGDQVDTRIDVRQVPSNPAFDPTVRGTFPAPQFRETDFWAQGVTAGLEFHF